MLTDIHDNSQLLTEGDRPKSNLQLICSFFIIEMLHHKNFFFSFYTFIYKYLLSQTTFYYYMLLCIYINIITRLTRAFMTNWEFDH